VTGPRGQSLELFFIDGRPDGMLTAEVFNWTGHVLLTPRTQISEALKRQHAQKTGVYILLGEDGQGPVVYIGEGDPIDKRIRDHAVKKDWWSSAVLITTSAHEGTLNKAHVQHLEARLIEIARSVGKVRLDNSTSPTLPSLSEAARSNMEAFLDYILLVLPALRIDAFLESKRPNAGVTVEARPREPAPMFELFTALHGIRATARLEDGDFVVLAGSHARAAWEGVGSEQTSYAKLHGELVSSGVLREDAPLRVFTDNYAFSSPSAAAAVVNGRPANGTIEWKVQGTATTYKAWETEQLARGQAEAAP
jgi:hypothetical protein